MRANARFLSGFTSHSDGIRVFPKFCARRFAPYICILLTANLHGAAAFHSPFGHTCSNRTGRIRLSLRKPAVFLPSQSFALMQTCQCAAPSVAACAAPPSSGRKAFGSRSPNLSLPLGEMSRSDREGLAPSLRELDLPQAKTEGAANYLSRIRRTLAQTCSCAAPSVTAYAVPPSSGRKALVLRANQTCLSLWERCRAATERAGSLFEGAGLPPCGKTEGVLQIGKIRMRFSLIRISPRKKRPAG